jgi:hypothetical protein
MGFKVGIRIQPFIPKISSAEIVDIFRSADYFTIEGLKLVPQNKEQKAYLLKMLNLNRGDFTQMGLLNLKPNIRLRLYEKTINKLEQYGIKYSIADNDLHQMTKSRCCCGENLIRNCTNFSDTAMYFDKIERNNKNIDERLGEYKQCNANHLFTSNRQDGCKTVSDFFNMRIDRDTSPFSDRLKYGLRKTGQKPLLEG